MRDLRVLITLILSSAGLGACVTPGGARPEAKAFEARPPRPAGCDFELFEEREPSRPYRVLGTLPFSSNSWMGAEGRKNALRDTVCQAGADAVLLPRPEVRWVNLGNRKPEELREYEARFLLYTDVPGTEPVEAQEATPSPPPSDALVVPASPEWDESWGTSTKQAEPAQAPRR